MLLLFRLPPDLVLVDFVGHRWALLSQDGGAHVSRYVTTQCRDERVGGSLDFVYYLRLADFFRSC